MLKNYNPVNIPTFSHDEDMEEVRTKTINPLTVEVNKIGVGFSDLQDVVTEHADKISKLESNGPSGGGSSTFLGLGDTPSDYSDSAGKTVVVNSTSDGIEFVDSQEVAILEALKNGSLPVNWNNMRQKISAASGDISSSQIASSAFLTGTGSSSSRFYYLPDIVGADTSPLPSESVREGRLTFISQQGSSARTVSLTNGCKFIIGGNMSTADLTIPAGQTWMFLPAIYDKGDKCWTLIGTFSANNKQTDTHNGHNRISSRSITSTTSISSSQIEQQSLVHASVASITGSTMRVCNLPELTFFTNEGLLKDNQCRMGKILTFWSSEATANMTLRVHDGQSWLINGVTSTEDRILPPGVMETFVGINHNNSLKWLRIGRCRSDNSPVEFVDLNARVTSLESGNGKAINKWYVLPLAGQSNMWGCGEAPWDINCTDGRIKQLGVMDSNPGGTSSPTNLNLNTCPYGSRYEEFRPMVDSNLKMIPSVPCLDTAANGFHVGCNSPVSGGKPVGTHIWGNTGLGHYLASTLLPYIPEDYGILIVNASRPGGGVCASSGSYDPVTMRPSSTANGHGDGHPFNLMLKDRVKLALEMNPDNKLLPLIWMQGESDPDAASHYDAFKNVITGWKKHLVDNGLDSRLPHGNIENMKIICLGTTKVIYGEDCGFDYLSNMTHNSFKHAYRGRYDNYAYLMDHPDFQNPITGEGYVTYVRVDIDEVGDFIETALEENRSNGSSKVFSSYLDTHFSSKALQNKIPRLILNAIGSSKTSYLTSPVHSRWTRYVPGRKGLVSTDNIRYEYKVETTNSFDPEDCLLVKKNYQTGNDFVDPNITETITTSPPIVTEGTSSFAAFNGASNTGWAGTIDYTGSSTISVMFRMRDSYRNADAMIIGSCGLDNGPSLWCQNGHLYLYPRKGTVTKAIGLNKAYVGAWKGTWEDWQHLTFSYNKNLEQVDVFLNGCLIHTILDSNIDLRNVSLGSFNGTSRKIQCDVKYFRIYSKCLSAKEAGTLYTLDVFGNGENVSTTKSTLETKLDEVYEELNTLKMLYASNVLLSKGVTNE